MLKLQLLYSAFLNRFPTIQILELAHFVSGLSTLVYAIRGQPHDSEDDCA